MTHDDPHGAETVAPPRPDPAPSPTCDWAPSGGPAASWCADLRARWRRGERVPAEAYLEREPGLRGDDEAALDLVYAEYVQRIELGESPQPDEYLRRFPRFAPRLERLFALDRALQTSGSGAGDTSASEAAPAAAARPGPAPEAIGRYRVIAPLDRGGQASVFRAVHPGLGKDVVIKLGHRPPPAGQADRDRLVGEGRVLAELDHPGLARVHDLDFHEGRPFLVMEYVRGRTLEQYAREHTLTPRQAAALVAGVARALAAAHRRGVLHRDLKPANILVEEGGRPRVIDFGLASLRDAWGEDEEVPGTVSGTATYMAPEQARGETDRFGPWTDVFALGGVLYFLLTGKPPFTGDGLSAILSRARAGDFDRAALRAARVPRRLEAICLRALAADPGRRYRRADDLAADLERFAAGRRWPLWPAAAAAVLLLGVALLGWRLGWWSAAAPPEEPTPRPAPAAVKSVPPALAAANLKPTLFVRVWERGRSYDLPNVVPLRTGSEVQVRAEGVPADVHAALFLLTSEGRLRRLVAWPAGAAARRFPEGEDERVPLTGPPGTEFLLACGRRAAPVTESEILALWGEPSRWPALPGESVLRLLPDRVVVEQRGRDFGPVRNRPDPQAEVRRHLEALRLRLRPHFDYLEGLAFAHQR